MACCGLFILCTLHTLGIGMGMGGLAGLTNPWPLARHDHPLYFHSALVTRAFLEQSGTTAGYDPSFMAGYAKSVVWPTSSTLPELVIFLFGSKNPARAYKLYVLISASLLPWLVAGAGRLWRLGSPSLLVTVLVFLVYVWTDFPIHYAAFGMVPYLLAIPSGLLATAVVSRYLSLGGRWWWLLSASASSIVFLVHPTTAMIVAPAAALAYASAAIVARRSGARWSVGRHVGVWTIPIVVLATNVFWWLPGVWLAKTKGPSDFTLAHSNESLPARLGQILSTEPPIQAVMVGLSILGMQAFWRRDRVAATSLSGFIAAGFAWGYLAGIFPGLDFLQPGRHTYAFYSGAAIASGVGVGELLSRLRAGGGRLAGCLVLALGLIGLRVFGPSVVYSVREHVLAPDPFLSSRPNGRMRWVLETVRRNVQPGERLLYEEGGKGIPGLPDPFQSGRYSGLLPHLAGIEVLGGPYLHASLDTNFTQFGEGKLFGEPNWDRAHFERYARLYRPAAILCWTPRARAFCRANPDLIEVLDTLDLRGEGTILMGRVIGFGGMTIAGKAAVKAVPGRLTVSGASADLDGRVVLRYHLVPYLRSRPPALLEPVRLEGDPVPFIGLRPGAGPLSLELDLPSLRKAALRP